MEASTQREILVTMSALHENRTNIEHRQRKSVRDLDLKRPEGWKIAAGGLKSIAWAHRRATPQAEPGATLRRQGEERAGWRTHNGHREGLPSAWSGHRLRRCKNNHEGGLRSFEAGTGDGRSAQRTGPSSGRIKRREYVLRTSAVATVDGPVGRKRKPVED